VRADLNLVFNNRDTQTGVKGLSDEWITVGPIRAAVHLAGVWHILQPKAFKWETATSCSLRGHPMFAPVDLEHPWVKWCLESHEQYGWLYFYAVDMAEEYKRRFGFDPYILNMLNQLEEMPEAVPEGGWEEPTFAKDIEYV